MGGNLGGTGGTVLQNLRWGGRPMQSSPNISRSSVFGSVAKYEATKKGVKEETFRRFSSRKGRHMIRVYNSRDRETTDKNRSMTIFFLKKSFENVGRESNFCRPPNSAISLHPWAA